MGTRHLSSLVVRGLGVSGVLAVSAASASAAITGVSGQTTWLGSSPVSCFPNQLVGLNAHTWDEQQSVAISGIPVDMTNNPAPHTSAIPGVISGVYDSHFIHFQGIPGVVGAGGSVTFNAPIAAVVFMNFKLDITDGASGSLGTAYPTGNAFRGLNAASAFSLAGNTLTFNLFAVAPTADIVQLRVYTLVPSPGAAGLGAAGLLLAARRRRAA